MSKICLHVVFTVKYRPQLLSLRFNVLYQMDSLSTYTRINMIALMDVVMFTSPWVFFQCAIFVWCKTVVFRFRRFLLASIQVVLLVHQMSALSAKTRLFSLSYFGQMFDLFWKLEKCGKYCQTTICFFSVSKHDLVCKPTRLWTPQFLCELFTNRTHHLTGLFHLRSKHTQSERTKINVRCILRKKKMATSVSPSGNTHTSRHLICYERISPTHPTIRWQQFRLPHSITLLVVIYANNWHRSLETGCPHVV